MKWKLLPIVLFFGCSALEGEQKTNVNDIIKSHEIKQVSQTDILIHGEKMGAEMLSALSSSLCDSVKWQSVSDSLTNQFQSKISIGFSVEDFESGDEKGLWDAYDYNAKNAIDSNPSAQLIGQDVLYVAPFINPDTTCSYMNDSTGMWSIKIPVKTVVNSI